MSKTTKWIIAIIIIAIAAWLLWKNNMLPAQYQSAAVVTTATGNPELDQINRDTASIDSQIRASMKEINALTNNSKPADVLAVATHMKAVIALVGALKTRLEAGAVNKNSAALKAAVNDLGVQFGNASSAVGAVFNNVKNIQADATVGTDTGLKQAILQMKVSHGYLQMVRTDIATIVAGLR